MVSVLMLLNVDEQSDESKRRIGRFLKSPLFAAAGLSVALCRRSREFGLRTMMLIYASNSVTADSCGWASEFDDTDLLIQSLDGNAEIRIRPYDCGSAPALNYLGEILRNSSGSRDRPLNAITVGQYSGYMVQYIDQSEDLLVREYLVSLAETMLDITLSCPRRMTDHYLPEASRILDSLRDNRP